MTMFKFMLTGRAAGLAGVAAIGVLGLSACSQTGNDTANSATSQTAQAMSAPANMGGAMGAGAMGGGDMGAGDMAGGDMAQTDLTRGPAPSEPAVLAGSVEIALKDRLDGDLSGYCFDILGGGQNINPDDGLQAHTCYSYRGALGSDQAADPDLFADGIIKISAFDVCAVAANPKIGDALALTKCDDSAAQKFDIDAEGHIRPSGDTSLCMTAGESTVRGRNGTSPHQIKTLTMQTCSPDNAAYQQWRTRIGAD